MIETGHLDVEKLEKKYSDGRKKYPWEELKSKGDFFIWDKAEAKRLRSAAASAKIKVSARMIGNKLHVIRMD